MGATCANDSSFCERFHTLIICLVCLVYASAVAELVISTLANRFIDSQSAEVVKAQQHRQNKSIQIGTGASTVKEVVIHPISSKRMISENVVCQVKNSMLHK